MELNGVVEIFLVVSCNRYRDRFRPDGPLDSLVDLISPVILNCARMRTTRSVVQHKNHQPTTFPCISVTDCNCCFFFVLLFPFKNFRWKTLENFWISVTLWECLKLIRSRLLTCMKARTSLRLVGTVLFMVQYQGFQ